MAVKQKTVATTGNIMVAEAMRQCAPDVMAAYPITPQTTIVEEFAKYVAQGRVNTEYVTVEIYDQTYHLSGQNADHIRELAACVDAKMRAVAAQGRTVDSLRVAVLAALNLADELALNASADPRQGHARAANLRGLLDEVLDVERKTGS